jgi:hypothetical protein
MRAASLLSGDERGELRHVEDGAQRAGRPVADAHHALRARAGRGGGCGGWGGEGIGFRVSGVSGLAFRV